MTQSTPSKGKVGLRRDLPNRSHNSIHSRREVLIKTHDKVFQS